MMIDAHELDALADDLKAGAEKAEKGVEKVLRKAAVNIKKEWRRNARATSGRSARHYPNTINYDEENSGMRYVIGPDKRGQGNLGAILEYGSVHNPPHHNGLRAADKEEPKLLKYIEKAAGDVL
jgi:HK97 gp10 family phage protein